MPPQASGEEKGPTGTMSKAGTSGGKGESNEMETLQQFCQYSMRKLSEIVTGDPAKDTKEAQMRKRIQDNLKTVKAGTRKPKQVVKDLTDYIKTLTPRAQALNLEEMFIAARKAKLSQGPGSEGPPRAVEAMKSVATKRPAGGSTDRAEPAAKKAKSGLSPGKSTPRIGTKKKTPQGQSVPQETQPSAPDAGSRPSAAPPPKDPSTAPASQPAGGGSKAAQQGAAAAAKKTEQRKQQSDDDILDVVKSAGIDVDAEDELLGLGADDQEDYMEGMAEDMELLSQPILRQKLEAIASRYSLDQVSRECLDFLSLAVRERLCNFMDMYLRVNTIHKEKKKAEWLPEQIVTVERSVGEVIVADYKASIPADMFPSKGNALRDCLFVLDHAETDTLTAVQSIRWHPRLHDISTGQVRAPPNYN